MISYDEDFIGDTLGELGNMGEETMSNAEPEGEQPSSSREIAEVVKSFYDAQTGKFPKGETGVVTHVKKQFGDRAGELAERLVTHLSQQGEAIAQEQESVQQFEDVLRLAGLIKEGGPDKSQVPAYKRKEKGGDWKMSTKDLEKEKTNSPTSSAGLARRKKELGMSEESHQASTTMKHVKNPTAGEKKAAKDIKPGIAGYRDRIDMLQSAKKDGRLKGEGFDPLKHVKNPTPGEKKAAKDVKRSSYADRAAMLKSAEADGRLKK
jgi:hypothetical protein